MKNKTLIIIVSILIPLIVALLFGIPKIEGVDTSFLPPIYASINALTALILITSFFQIKKGNKGMHEKLMMFAMGMSVVFLAMYVTYHSTSEATKYLGDGYLKFVYYVILVSHILLSMIIVPLVLFSVHYAKIGNLEKHKNLVKWSFPIWLYVALSGVIVYLMISPYY